MSKIDFDFFANRFHTNGFVIPLNMIKRQKILLEIKRIVNSTEPKATVILFGSYARGDNKKFSDIDILILVDKDKITYSDEKRIKYPLYDLEFDSGIVISPIVFSRKDWESRHSITPFYKNVEREGILL
jgi:predicted nucleotidyltransferase